MDEIKGITEKSYSDANIFSGIEYRYQVKAVDQNEIESEPSEAVEISSDELPAYIENKEEAPTGEPEPAKVQKKKPNVAPTPDSSIEAAPDLDTSSL